MEPADTSTQRTLDWRIALGICAALLLLFAAISFSAASTKSATYDEPLHTLGGILRRTTGELRLNAEDPPFFGFWASLPQQLSSIRIDFDSQEWRKYVNGEQDNQWAFTMMTLYRNGNDADAIIQRSRSMFIIIGILLGTMIAWWSWQLAGAWAALVAVAFFSFDPNFLAHSALVKNDVMLSLLMLAVATAIWRFGRRGTWLSMAGIAVATALALNVKFSAVLLGPIIFATLLIRALLPQTWIVFGKTLEARWQRLIVVPVACAIVGFTSYLGIWACYGFRFAPAADHRTTLNMSAVVDAAKTSRVRYRVGTGVTFTSDDVKAEPTPPLVSVFLWVESHRLLPQAWIYGFVYTYATTISRTSFLMGQESNHGFFLYFPLAMLFKTPTATLLAIPGALAAAVIVYVVRKRNDQQTPQTAEQASSQASVISDASGNIADCPRTDAWNLWTLACFVVPPGIYFFSALTANMNIGLRHVLPVYPFIFIAMGIGFAMLIRRRKMIGGIAVGALLLGLAAESLLAFPDYIPFFNAPSGGSAGGIRLLSDSNLDWGQDLELLAKWRSRHLDKPVYLSYFGVADPDYYFGKYLDISRFPTMHMPGGWSFVSPGEPRQFPPQDQPCYLVVSATNLQGVYYLPDMKQVYFQLNEIYPKQIIGGSIYIYELPPTAAMFKNPQRGSPNPTQ